MPSETYRDELKAELAGVDWDAARVETQPVDESAMPDNVAEEDHTPEGDDVLVLEQDGDGLDELTEDGETDQGVVGDGAYVPESWWHV